MHMIIIERKTLYNFIFSVALILSVSALFGYNGNTIETLAPSISGKTIVIDAGHGLPDGGAVGISGTAEYEINLKIARELGVLLQQSGVNVVYTREDDNSVAEYSENQPLNLKREDLNIRKNIINESDADLFISIHMNKFEDSKYKGAQVFYDNKLAQNEVLAKSIQKYLRHIADTSNNREAKNSAGNIYLLKNSQIPSALVECGFISNADEEAKLKTESYQKEIAFSIYCGIIDYINESK